MSELYSFRAYLSAIDQIQPRHYLHLVLAFPTTNSDVAARIEAGLEKVGEQLPYLRGRVSSCDPAGRLELIWTCEDPVIALQRFSTAVPVSTSSAPKIPSYLDLKRNGFPIHLLNKDICPGHTETWLSGKLPEEAEVMSVGWTPLVRGALMHVLMHNAVMDARGAGKIVRLLSHYVQDSSFAIKSDEQAKCFDQHEPLARQQRISAGSCWTNDWRLDEELEKLMAHNERIDEQTVHVTRIGPELRLGYPALLALHSEFTTQPHLIPSDTAACTSKVFAFSMLWLVQVAQSLGKDASTLGPDTLLCAIIWTCISRVRFDRKGLARSTLPRLTNLAIQCNCYGALARVFGEIEYLGNTKLYVLAQLDVDHCVGPEEAFLMQAVKAINEAKKRLDAQYVAEVVDLVDSAPNPGLLMPSWNSDQGLDLTLVSWLEFSELYGCDFGPGIGAPEIVRIPLTERDGMVIVLPMRAVGAVPIIEVAVMLRADDMMALERDELWANAVKG